MLPVLVKSVNSVALITNLAIAWTASWELDLWGKQRRSIESAEAGLDAADDDLRDVLVSLYAEVALNYIDVRRYQNELIVAKDSLKTQQETYDIAYWRQQAGLVSRVDVLQAINGCSNFPGRSQNGQNDADYM